MTESPSLLSQLLMIGPSCRPLEALHALHLLDLIWPIALVLIACELLRVEQSLGPYGVPPRSSYAELIPALVILDVTVLAEGPRSAVLAVLGSGDAKVDPAAWSRAHLFLAALGTFGAWYLAIRLEAKMLASWWDRAQSGAPSPVGWWGRIRRALTDTQENFYAIAILIVAAGFLALHAGFYTHVVLCGL
jgi:hypothetical protein